MPSIPRSSHLEQKNEKVKFLRIDTDVNETTFKEKEEDDVRPQRKQAKKDAESLSEIFKKALGNDKLEVKVKQNESVASMITVSEENAKWPI